MHRLPLVLPTLVLVLPTMPGAQSSRALLSLLSPAAPATTGFGTSLTVIDDINGDGVAELVVGAPGAAGGAGEVTAFDGSSGAVVWTVVGTSGWTNCSGGTGADALGTVVSRVFDFDADGFDDVLALAPTARDFLGQIGGGCSSPLGDALVLSGKTGVLLGSCPTLAPLLGPPASYFPSAIELPDTVGNGVPGFGLISPGFLHVWIGPLLQPPALILSPFPLSIGATEDVLAGPFDLDGDGVRDEIALGDTTLGTVRLVKVVPGTAPLVTLATVTGPAGSGFATTIAGQDVGLRDELLVGAPLAAVGAGEVYRIALMGGAPVVSLAGTAPVAPPGTIGTFLAAGQTYGNGKAVFATIHASTIRAYDDQSTSPAQRVQEPGVVLTSVAIGDLNKDGIDDYLAATSSPAGEGAIVLSGGLLVVDEAFEPGCSANPGLAPVPALLVGRMAPGDGRIQISNTLPGSLVALFLGTPTHVGTSLGSCNAFLDLSPSAPFPLTLVALTNTNGAGILDWFTFPPVSMATLGLEVGIQAAVDQTSGSSVIQTTTNTARVTIGW